MNSSSPNVTPQQIEQVFTEAGIPRLPEGASDRFLAYLDLMMRWNARLNLTSVRDPGQIISRHFAECAFAAHHLPEDIESLLDYGSGAGLPGIPIAICRPEIRVTLAEAQGKKASFLREAVRVLGTGSEVYDGRVENMPAGRHFHAVSMRAVEKMEQAIPTAMLRAGRYLVLLTSEGSRSAYRQLTPEFGWGRPIPLPNADRTVLAIGRRSEM
jgi:16S rRNA (guanine527-N7)-methyltransferase